MDTTEGAEKLYTAEDMRSILRELHTLPHTGDFSYELGSSIDPGTPVRIATFLARYADRARELQRERWAVEEAHEALMEDQKATHRFLGITELRSAIAALATGQNGTHP